MTSQLNFSLGQIRSFDCCIWDFIFLALVSYAFGHLFSIMEKRRELVMTQMNEATRLENRRLRMWKNKNRRLNNARQEAYEIIEQSK